MHRPILAAFLATAADLPRAPQTPQTPPQVSVSAREVGLQLEGPRVDTYVGAATEWRLVVENRSTDKLPLSRYTLGLGGHEGVRIDFEVARSEKPTLRLPPDFTLHGPCGLVSGNSRVEGVDSRSRATLDVALHCMLDYDWSTDPENPQPRFLFPPVFSEPGPHVVTAVLTWGGEEWRSNPVTVVIVPSPASWTDALRSFNALVSEGLCLDVNGVVRTNGWSRLARVEQFAVSNRESVYGAQVGLGLAEAYLRWLPMDDVDKKMHATLGLGVSLDRVQELRGDRARAVELGLERTWDRVDELVRRIGGSKPR
jgi:hypothetical protein